MASNFYGAIGLTGGGTGALDAIDGSILNDGDGALVVDAVNDKFYLYTLNATSAGDDGLSIIPPVTSAGTKRWILCASGSQISTTLSATVARLTASDITLGDAGEILLDAAPASDLTGTGIIISQTVDANSYGIAGCLVLSSDGNWDGADADAEATIGRLGLAMETGTGTKLVMLKGIMRNDIWNFTPGSQLYVSTAVGEITDTAPSGVGDFVQVVGYSLTDDIIIFEPSPDYIELV